MQIEFVGDDKHPIFLVTNHIMGDDPQTRSNRENGLQTQSNLLGHVPSRKLGIHTTYLPFGGGWHG